MEALILAAGRGSRLRPFSDYIPKPLLPIKRRAVILQSLETLKACAFKKVVVTVGYLEGKVIAFVEKEKPEGLEIEFAYQKELLGSADAIKVGMKKIEEDFLTLAGDTVFPAKGVSEVINEFKNNNFEAVVGLKKVKEKDLREKSSTLIDKDNFLKKVIEKPKKGEELSNISVAPIYFFQRQVIDDYLKNLRPVKSGVYELANALQNLIDNGGKVKGVFIEGSVDITYPEDVLRHNFPYLAEFLK